VPAYVPSSDWFDGAYAIVYWFGIFKPLDLQHSVVQPAEIPTQYRPITSC